MPKHSTSAAAAGDVVSRAEFARRVGLSRGRITQLVHDGLPTAADGGIPLDAGLAWLDAHLDPARRKVGTASRPSGEGPAPDESFSEARRQHEWAKVQRARLALERDRGSLIDRARATALVFRLAREERDSWLSWPPRIAALMAAELGVEAHAMQAVLDRYVRQHLTELAEIKFEG